LSVILTDSEIDKLEENFEDENNTNDDNENDDCNDNEGSSENNNEDKLEETPRRMKRTKNKPDSYYNFDRKKAHAFVTVVCAFILFENEDFFNAN